MASLLATWLQEKETIFYGEPHNQQPHTGIRIVYV